MDEIQQLTGSARGYLNWQGVLNTAFRLRGQEIFIDMVLAPNRARHIFEVVTETMIQSVKMLYARQRQAGVDNQFLSISNCTVNMAGPRPYEELLLPCDRRIRSEFQDFGIHNCAWSVTPYLDAYATIAGVGYIDMGLHSDMKKAHQLFPDARRNLLYTSMDLKDKSDEELSRISNGLPRTWALAMSVWPISKSTYQMPASCLPSICAPGSLPHTIIDQPGDLDRLNDDLKLRLDPQEEGVFQQQWVGFLEDRFTVVYILQISYVSK